MSAATARYMYAITRGLSAADLAPTVGIDGGRVDTVEHRGLVAVVSDVALDEYDEEALHQNLERLDWLEKVARSHDEVIQAAAALAPVAPLRLATICHDDTGVRDRLDEWHEPLQAALDRVAGNREWSVKVVAATPATPQQGARPVSGADYLRNKKAAAQARAEAEQAVAVAGDEIHAVLEKGVVASRRLPPQDPRLSGHSGAMVLNGAYLVDAEAADRFRSTVEELAAAHPHVVVECGGPWPPYSFATLEQP